MLKIVNSDMRPSYDDMQQKVNNFPEVDRGTRFGILIKKREKGSIFREMPPINIGIAIAKILQIDNDTNQSDLISEYRNNLKRNGVFFEHSLDFFSQSDPIELFKMEKQTTYNTKCSNGICYDTINSTNGPVTNIRCKHFFGCEADKKDIDEPFKFQSPEENTYLDSRKSKFVRFLKKENDTLMMSNDSGAKGQKEHQTPISVLQHFKKATY